MSEDSELDRISDLRLFRASMRDAVFERLPAETVPEWLAEQKAFWAEWEPDYVAIIAQVEAQFHEWWKEESRRRAKAKKARRPRQRKVTLAAALRQADKVGRQVSGAVINGDTVELRFGKTLDAPTSADGEAESWIRKHAH